MDDTVRARVECSTAARDNPLAPPAQVRKLTATMWGLLHELLFLEQCFAARHPGRVPYAWCSQAYLARKLGVSREWVSRCTTWLHREGFLRKRVRRKVNGRWQTCIYQLASAVGWKIRKTLNLLSLVGRGVNNTAHLATTFCRDSLNSRAARAQQAAAPP